MTTDGVRLPCPHEIVRLYEWDINQETMCLNVYSVVCDECGAYAKAEDSEVVLGPWEGGR